MFLLGHHDFLKAPLALQKNLFSNDKVHFRWLCQNESFSVDYITIDQKCQVEPSTSASTSQKHINPKVISTPSFLYFSVLCGLLRAALLFSSCAVSLTYIKEPSSEGSRLRSQGAGAVISNHLISRDPSAEFMGVIFKVERTPQHRF